MKLKRFLAVVISLAMVLSVVPAFSLTASAADMTDDALLAYAKTQSASFDMESPAPTGTSDTAVATAYPNSGITATINNGYLNVNSGPRFQSYIGSSTNGYQAENTLNLPGYGSGKDWVLVSFVTEYTNAWGDLTFYDIDGKSITAMRYGTSDSNAFNMSWGHTGWGSNGKFADRTYTLSTTSSTNVSSGSTQVDVLMRNYDTYYTAAIYVGGSLYATGTYTDGTFNGLGTIGLARQSGSAWQRLSVSKMKIYAGDIPASSVEVVATYTVGGATVKTVTKTYDSSSASGVEFDAVYYSKNGENTLYKAEAQTLSESATIAMEQVANVNTYPVGTEFTVDGTPYKVTGTNLIPNSNFAEGINGWYAGDGNAATSVYFSVSNNALVPVGGGGSGSAQGLYRVWDIENGKTYGLVFDIGADIAWGTVKTTNSTSRATSDVTTLIADGGLTAGNHLLVFTADAEYLAINAGWLSSSTTFSNFGLYEVAIDASKIANTTIKFVDSSNTSTEIATAVTVTGVVGDVITIADYAPDTITYNSNLYSKDSTNVTSYTVAGNTDTVTLTYTTDAVTSFAAVTATVIEGNDPILPTTITGYTGSGAATDVEVTWGSYTGLSAGTHTITGTADGINATATATVTVLSETFSLADTDVPASSDTTLTFPENISGEFVMEFDYTPYNVQNNWIYISADGNLWGAGQIGLGTSNDTTGTLNSMGTQTALGTVESGKTYRVLVTGNASTDTYTVVVTLEDGSTWTCSNTFRAKSDYINSIRMLPNGNAGSFAVKNIKVYNANTTLQAITIKATGSVSETYTVKATSAEVAPIPHYDGHIMKTRTISGTTVTATYEATTTSIGSWYMRNNFTDDNWITQSKYIGSHDAFADTDDVSKNEGGALYGDTGASSTGSTAVSNSRAQSVGVVDQLNAGVRYFDIRLSRQSDGTFATVHGPAFENFRDVAISMAQWAKENPGEVIILDFQTVRDALYDNSTYTVITDNSSYYGPDKGDDNQYVYDALVQLFKDTGLADYMTTNWDRKYGALTSSGTVTAILPFGKGRAVNCQGSYFINRSALNNDVTYNSSSSYSTIVSYLDSTYSSLTDGATISTIHAYTTPVSLTTSGNSLLNAAATNNPNWINEENFYNWMGYGKGDVLMMNDSVSDIDTYYAALNKFNRTGSSYSYTENFIRTSNGVTINGAQANVPFSTKWTVNKGDASKVGTLTIDGVEYTPVTAYTLDLMQFNTDSVQPTGTVNITFPQVSDGATTVDVLLSADGTTVYQTANVGEAISIDTTVLADVILATKAAPGVNLTVQYVADGTTVYSETDYYAYGRTAYSVPAGDFYIKYNGKAYIVNSDSAKTHTVSTNDTDNATLTVELTMVSENAVLEDMLVDNDNNVWGINTTNDNSIFVAAAGADRRGPLVDADGVSVTDEGINPATLGGSRNGYLQFPVVELGEGEAAIAKFYVREWHGNTFANGNTTIRISATAINDDSWTTLTDGAVYTDTAAPKLSAYETVMFSSKSTNVAGYITFDVTEMMKAAKEAGLSTITMRLGTAWGAAYIVEREKTVAGGAYQGKAAYIDVVDAETVSIAGATKVTKNGTDVTAFAKNLVVPENATIKVTMPAPESGKYSDTVVAYVDTEGNVYDAASAFSAAGTITPLTFGLEMVSGAQVRIGSGVDSEGKVGSNSGLRFITTVNMTDTLVSLDNATFGVRITAEGSDKTIDIPAESYQNDEKTVFTAALTNLKVGNYNRKFTATPYVTVDGQTFYGTPVTRSIYQVAAGLLTKDDADGTEYSDTALESKALYNVLNAYVNQTGIRLSLTSDGLTAYTGTGTSAYSGEQFFEVVSSETVSENVYTITIKPAGEKTTINSYWQEYIRINNNNSQIAAYTSLVENEDGSVTITFDYASYLEAKDADTTTE